MRALVTGAQGWLGRYLCSELLCDASILILGLGRSPRTDRFTHEFPRNGLAPLPCDLKQALEVDRYSYRRCDLLDIGDIRGAVKDFSPSHIFHLAGAGPGKSPSELRRLNIEASRNLSIALVEYRRPLRLVFASSGSVYGEPVYLPQDERHPLGAVTEYAQSNREAETAVLEVCEGTEVEAVIARIFNLVGPGCPGSLLPGSLAQQLAATAGGRQSGGIEMGPLDTIRDYVDVRDCAAALRHLGTLKTPDYPIYNIASGIGTKVENVWTRLRDIALNLGARPVTCRRLPPFPDNVSALVGDVGRLSASGFSCSIPLGSSLHDLYRWALAAIGDGTECSSALRTTTLGKKGNLNG